MRLTIRGSYPPDWSARSRAAKDASGWRCIRCRHPFDPATGRPLPCDSACDASRGRHRPEVPGLNFGVHHLDGDKANGAWWNTLPLCNSCHLCIQARVIPERPWIVDHSPWFIPYACGFYAHFYGGRAISREQAEADPDRWLALGQPWRATAAGGAA